MSTHTKKQDGVAMLVTDPPPAHSTTSKKNLPIFNQPLHVAATFKPIGLDLECHLKGLIVIAKVSNYDFP